MKLLKVLVMSIAFTASLLGAQRLLAADPIPAGLLKFAGHPDGTYKPCSLAVRSGEYAFNVDDQPCTNDRMNYFQFDGAPSATLITLYSNSDKGKKTCQENSGVTHGWKYTIKTIKQPTTTQWVKIDDLHSKLVDDIVVAGVVLVEKYERSGDRIDELSCVKVVRSDLP